MSETSLGARQIEVLREAAMEVAAACPWLPQTGTRREVRSLASRALVSATDDLFAITPRGILALRRYHRLAARAALTGLRESIAAGDVMPWDV